MLALPTRQAPRILASGPVQEEKGTNRAKMARRPAGKDVAGGGEFGFVCWWWVVGGEIDEEDLASVSLARFSVSPGPHQEVLPHNSLPQSSSCTVRARSTHALSHKKTNEGSRVVSGYRRPGLGCCFSSYGSTSRCCCGRLIRLCATPHHACAVSTAKLRRARNTHRVLLSRCARRWKEKKAS